MSLASLAAYASSDEESEAEDSYTTPNTSQPNGTINAKDSSVNSNVTVANSGPSDHKSAVPTAPSGVDLIDDAVTEDDVIAGAAAALTSSLSVTSSLPPSDHGEEPAGSVFQADDVVDDVPLAEKLLAKKPTKTGKVRITIPSLAEFRDEDGEPTAKKPKNTVKKGSGLFALLPPPKTQPVKQTGRTLLPQSVSRSAAARRPAPPPPPPPPGAAPTAGGPARAAPPVSTPDSDGEDEHTPAAAAASSGGDFFSLSDEQRIPSHPAMSAAPALHAGPLTYGERLQMEQQAERERLQQLHAAAEAQQAVAMETDAEAEARLIEEEDRQRQAESRLDMEALEQLGGRRGRGAPRDIQVVDVCQDDIVASKTEWMTKALTEEAVVRRPQRSADDPTSQQRRKHQITYLAHQAKEREVELKNEWAQNRVTKNAYRSKYGF